MDKGFVAGFGFVSSTISIYPGLDYFHNYQDIEQERGMLGPLKIPC